MKVLIIDDEPIVRRALSRAFQKKGHDVLVAEGGVSGLEQWKQSSPEVIMIDVLMPDMNGPKVIEKMGPEGESSYVVLMSAFTGEFDSQRAKAYGANEFLSKPFSDVFEIVERIEKEIV